MPQIDFYLIARTDPSAPGPGRRQRTVLYQQGHLQGTLLDFGGRFALEPPRGNQHRQAARARLATEKPAVLRRHIPVWPVREAAACGLPEAERAAIVGRSRRFGLSGRAGISSKCEILGYSVLGWVFRHCGVGTPIDPHDLLRSLRWTPVGVGPQPGYTRRLGKQ